MGCSIVKIGGSVLREPENALSVLRLLAEWTDLLVVVVSALSGVTNQLIAIANEKDFDKSRSIAFKLQEQYLKFFIGDWFDGSGSNQIRSTILSWTYDLLSEIQNPIITPDRLGRILSMGERLTASCFSIYLHCNNMPNVFLEPNDLGFRVCGTYRNAFINKRLSRSAVRKALASKMITVVPGFYGYNRKNRVMLFGRGGSDYTAAFIASCIEARQCVLVKDTPGVMTADPKILVQAQYVERLSYREAYELACGGMKIIHPRAISVLKQARIPLHVLGLSGYNKGTLIETTKKARPRSPKAIMLGDGPFGMAKIIIAGEGVPLRMLYGMLEAVREKGIVASGLFASVSGASVKILVESDRDREAFGIVHDFLFSN